MTVLALLANARLRTQDEAGRVAEVGPEHPDQRLAATYRASSRRTLGPHDGVNYGKISGTEQMSETFLAGDPAPLLYADTHPAWCAAHGRRGKRLAVGASVVGRRHILGYRARDDAFVLMGSGAHIVAAVADGVWGGMFSRIAQAPFVH